MKKYESADIPAAAVGDWAQRYAPRSGATNDIWHGKVAPEEIRQSRQAYYGSVSHVDEQVGRILEVLEERKLLDQTLIVFLADHGDMLGDHNLWRKTYAYEASSRIPMLMRWPTGMLSPNVESPAANRWNYAIFSRRSSKQRARRQAVLSMDAVCCRWFVTKGAVGASGSTLNTTSVTVRRTIGMR